MTVVLIGGQLCVEHASYTHGVLPVGSDVHGREEAPPEIQFCHEHWLQPHDWHLLDELLGTLHPQLLLIVVPPGSLYLEA